MSHEQRGGDVSPARPLTPPVGAEDAHEFADVIVLQAYRRLITTPLCRDTGRDWFPSHDVCLGAIRRAETSEQQGFLVNLLVSQQHLFAVQRAGYVKAAHMVQFANQVFLAILADLLDVSSGSIFWEECLNDPRRRRPLAFRTLSSTMAAPSLRASHEPRLSQFCTPLVSAPSHLEPSLRYLQLSQGRGAPDSVRPD